MRFVNISRLGKFSALISRFSSSRNFIFIFVLLAVSLPVIFSTFNYYLSTRNSSKALTSPVGQKGQELGISSPSAQLNPPATPSAAEAPKPAPPKPAPKPVEAKPVVAVEPEPAAVTNVTVKSGRLNFANNKFGIYTNNVGGDLDLAAQLVNSHGGDWGWILIPMAISENGTDHWNSIFSKLSEKHLIPIIQLIEPDAAHKIPDEGQIDAMAKFLNSLSWPTKLKVVSAFNEMNASEYWGGKIDPEGYARILNRLIDQLKQQNSDFFVLNGAFNASAQTGSPDTINCIKTDLGVDSCYLSEIGYLRRMNGAIPNIFKKLDGWASHAYPHPAYRGRPTDTQVGAESSFEVGRNTIHSYQFELRLLRRDYGLSLPVFITETGWPHKEGQTAHPEWYDVNTVANYYKQAFVNYFLPDGNVVAVTPFTLTNNFDNFAFVAVDGSKFPQWDALAGITKTAGNPPR